MSALLTPPDEQERMRARLELVTRLGETIGDARDLVELFRTLHAETSRVMDTTVFLLSMYDAASETVHVVRQIDRGEEHEGGSFPLGKGFTSEVIRTGVPKLVRRWATEGPPIRLLYGTESGELVTPQSAAIVPIISKGQVVGVISTQSYAPQAYDDTDIATLGAIASHAATAIKHMRATEQMALAYRRHALELEAVLANMSDALVIVDARGAIVRLNREARELLGLDGASLVLGQPLAGQRLEHLPKNAREIAAALLPIVDSVRAGASVDERDVELTIGQHRVLSVSATVLGAAGAEPQGGVIVFRDVTSQRELERLREDVFAMAWHDMHTPITVIRGHAALLLARVKHGRLDKKSFVNAAELIVKHSDRLADLLTALFDIRCLQAGMLKLSRWPTDLGLLAAELVEGLNATSRHKLVVDASEGVIGEWDERRIRQVVTNLLSNAAKYSSEGSTISVSVRADSDHATVSVRDEGIGMEADEIGQLFRRGYRANRALNVRGGGLGLYLAHGLVSAHGGRMWAESPGHDRGSTFSFALPIGTREGETGTTA